MFIDTARQVDGVREEFQVISDSQWLSTGLKNRSPLFSRTEASEKIQKWRQNGRKSVTGVGLKVQAKGVLSKAQREVIDLLKLLLLQVWVDPNDKDVSLCEKREQRIRNQKVLDILGNPQVLLCQRARCQIFRESLLPRLEKGKCKPDLSFDF